MEQQPAADNRRMFLYLLILTSASTFGLQGWRSLITNFCVERAGLGGFEMGVLQSVREVPGLLSLLVIYLLCIISERRLAALAVVLLGVGAALAGFLPNFSGIILTTLIMSFGFHYFEPVNQSLTLQYFNKGYAPIVAGRLRSVAAATSIFASGFIFVLAFFLNYTSMFLLVGMSVVLVGFGCLFFDPTDKNIPPQHKKMILRRRYWLYYALTFMAGARRQIFVAFALFLLVEKFKFPVQGVTALFIVNNVVLFFLSPLIGRAINRFGERAVLSIEYSGLFFVFLTYAFTDSTILVTLAYVVNQALFNCSIAINTFFQKIADPQDIAPSMAVGFAINHIAAVIIPVFGGLMWLSHQRLVFVGAAGLAVCSFILCRMVPSKEKLANRA
ncbi:MAG: MFS transporter [Desulfovibrionaceae bacterium]|jgi:predicted MFS family arabinose efflux permease